MKKIILSSVILTGMLCSCQQDKKTTEQAIADATNKTTQVIKEAEGPQDIWAEQIEANTSLVKPDGWADEDWKAVNKNVDNKKIYTTIVDAVISGKLKAYDFFTNSAYTVEEIKSRLANITADQISAIRTTEKWAFDKENFKLTKQITRLNLFTQKLDSNGDYLGDKALFYVNLNN